MWLWALLPVLLAVAGIVGFWAVFAMAVANGSVNITEAFPYISTCGAYPPQSCLFGQVLNLGAFLGVVICYLKYQQVRDYGCQSRLNLAGLITGLLCALGASIVGNFQQYNQVETHLFGAFLAFVVGVVYFWIQTFLTERVKPRHGGPWIGPLRFSLTFCGSVFLIAAAVLFWLKLHSESAYCEWALAMDLFLLFGLFAVDFWHIGSCSVHVHHQRADPETRDTQASTQTLSL
ncbi:modulator of macroautophagy TMEM150B [Pogona vitticeps]